ncbi:Alpha-2-macroglobulin-like protein 1 [Anabarilius grahami]|uniref:Alpha-2-macroglobulin-like protein 1 n=1 Tax=Anabarilius grahami TaxID=495550 RepID=A0A3N0Z3Q8_ANAGA|nr:Alpha-2-macroglobulin-like protein 1 [Anabarilius grahami]
MAVREICVWKGLILALFLFAVEGQKRPLFMVTFPAVIESGSDAKLCATLLKPQESLTLTVSLLDDKNRMTKLVQQSSSMPLHRCFSFKAPLVDGESVQNLKVEVQGKVFSATEERKVMFRRYLPLTFIQTDKPIYNPGQTVIYGSVYYMPLHLKAGDADLAPILDLVLFPRYTYGQPVPGQALVEVCRDPFPYVEVPGVTRQCLRKTMTTNATGCASLTVDTSVFFNTKFENSLQDLFIVTVNVTEEGTDVVLSKPATVSITFEVGKVTFVDLPGYFEPGSTINGKAIANKAVYLLDGNSNKLLLNLTTNQNGLATFSLNTANLPKAALNLVASVTPEIAYSYKSPYFTTDTRVVQLLQPDSPNNPSLGELTIVMLEQPLKCGGKYPVTVKYSFVGESGDYSADIVYMASLQFSPATAVPAERNVLTVSAQAGSLCGLSAVDQSVWILEPGRRLSAKMVFDLLPVRSLSSYPYSVEDGPCFGVRPLRANRAYTVPTNTQAYSTFKSVGMKVATNLAVRAPLCRRYPGLPIDVERTDVVSTAPPEAGSAGDEGTLKVTVRTYFPETWIWQLVQVGATGSTQVPLTVPDTITTWETEAFCLSSKGLGLAPPAQLTVFQPFFLELSLPYSIVRGESFELKATVFSYLSKLKQVQLHPRPSLLVHLMSRIRPVFVLMGERPFKWVLTASVLGAVNVTVNASAEPSRTRCGTEAVTVLTRGRVDVVTRSLLVLPEGVERTNTQSWLLCPKGLFAIVTA